MIVGFPVPGHGQTYSISTAMNVHLLSVAFNASERAKKTRTNGGKADFASGEL